MTAFSDIGTLVAYNHVSGAAWRELSRGVVSGHVKDCHTGVQSLFALMFVRTSKSSRKTTQSYLVFVTVQGDTSQTPYQIPLLASNAARNFLSGPGEGMPLHALTLQFEGVIRIEGHLLRRVHRIFMRRTRYHINIPII